MSCVFCNHLVYSVLILMVNELPDVLKETFKRISTKSGHVGSDKTTRPSTSDMLDDDLFEDDVLSLIDEVESELVNFHFMVYFNPAVWLC